MIPVNDPPVVFDTSLTVLEDGTCVGILEGYDPEGQNITFSAGCPPERGTVLVSSEPSLTSARFNYTSFPGSAGTDSFIVTVSDGELEGFGLVSHRSMAALCSLHIELSKRLHVHVHVNKNSRDAGVFIPAGNCEHPEHQ